jgi:DNA invertase Pin-like site-specific DNA recombinase
MGRKQILDEEQIEQIRNLYNSGTPVLELSKSYGVSKILIYRVINKTGAYRDNPLNLGNPVLDAHGMVVNVTPTNS